MELLLYLSKVTNFKQITTGLDQDLAILPTVALPLKGNEFQANHNVPEKKVAILLTVALPLKGNEFQANHNSPAQGRDPAKLLLYLSKVTNFKQITTPEFPTHQGGYCCFTSQR